MTVPRALAPRRGEHGFFRPIEEKTMCQSDVYIIEGGEEKLLMKETAWIEYADDGLILRNDFGEQKTVPARLKVADLVQHRIVLEPIETG